MWLCNINNQTHFANAKYSRSSTWEEIETKFRLSAEFVEQFHKFQKSSKSTRNEKSIYSVSPFRQFEPNLRNSLLENLLAHVNITKLRV